MNTFFSTSSAETVKYGQILGSSLQTPCVICLFGELAAGKTTLIKGIVEGATGLDPSIVQSPTFTYLNIYNGTKTIYHFDLYRLRDIDEFLSMGFDEYLDGEGICLIEWSERIVNFLPTNCLIVSLEHSGEDTRLITTEQKGS